MWIDILNFSLKSHACDVYDKSMGLWCPVVKPRLLVVGTSDIPSFKLTWWPYQGGFHQLPLGRMNPGPIELVYCKALLNKWRSGKAYVDDALVFITLSYLLSDLSFWEPFMSPMNLSEKRVPPFHPLVNPYCHYQHCNLGASQTMPVVLYHFTVSLFLIPMILDFMGDPLVFKHCTGTSALYR